MFLGTEYGLGYVEAKSRCLAKDSGRIRVPVKRRIRITVYFTWGNTAENITLNVGGTGAKPVFYKSNPAPANFIQTECGIDMVYYAGAWRIIGDSQKRFQQERLQSQYNALSSSDKLNGTVYFITDGT